MCSGLTAAVISVIGARTRRLVAQLYTPQHLSRPEQQTAQHRRPRIDIRLAVLGSWSLREPLKKSVENSTHFKPF